jgi:hypothetical protein
MKTNAEAFIEALEKVDDGLFLNEIGDKLAAVVTACLARGKKGGIQISLGLKPGSKGRLEMVARVDSALPKSDNYGASFYGTEDGHLSRRDPRQPELPGLDPRGEEEDPDEALKQRFRDVVANRAQKERSADGKSKVVPMSGAAS